MKHTTDALNKLRELRGAEKPFTDAEAIVKAFEAQGCRVSRSADDDGNVDEYEILSPFEGTLMVITLWIRKNGLMHFSLFVDALNPEVAFTVDGETRRTDELGVTLGPCLFVKEHGKVTIRGRFEERELTW